MSNGNKKNQGIELDCFEDKAGDINNILNDIQEEKSKEEKTNEKNTKTANKVQDGLDEEIKEFVSSPEADTGPPVITIVPREEWSKIEPPEEYLTYSKPVEFVLLTHTGTSSCNKSEECIRILRTIQRSHIALGYADIVYNFLIGGDGKVYEGRGWKWESAWIPKFHEDMGPCIKIAHIGYYGDNSKKKIKPEDVKLQCDLVEVGMYKNHVQWNATMVPDINEPDEVAGL